MPYNLRVHHAKAVAAWLNDHKSQIELFVPPPYAKEYNPDKLLNSDIKRNAGARKSPRTQAELKSGVRSRLNMLDVHPDHAASFFRARLMCYAF